MRRIILAVLAALLMAVTLASPAAANDPWQLLESSAAPSYSLPDGYATEVEPSLPSYGYLKYRFGVSPPSYEEFERVVLIDVSHGYVDFDLDTPEIETPTSSELLDLWLRRGSKIFGWSRCYYEPKFNVLEGQRFAEWYEWMAELLEVTYRRMEQRPSYCPSVDHAHSFFISDMRGRGYPIHHDDLHLEYYQALDGRYLPIAP